MEAMSDKIRNTICNIILNDNEMYEISNKYKINSKLVQIIFNNVNWPAIAIIRPIHASCVNDLKTLYVNNKR